MKVTILGCGASAGVPMVGCDCKICQSDNPRNKRTRVSIFLEINGINILIDTSPDLRQQALRQNIRRIDTVLYIPMTMPIIPMDSMN
jgi:phosphoribosyl 1,2-cyclic phosphate phosphodiesterase